jgi:hypothetical protein
MKNRNYWWLVACMCCLLGISVSVPAKSDDTGRPGFTEADQAFYLDEELYTFIRPGLEYELIEFEIPSDRQPLVTFSIKDPGGLPLDRAGIYTPGPVDLRFMLSYIPAGETQKINYHGVGDRDRNGVFTDMGDGVYTYKFGDVLPADYDVDATHTLASVATRDLREWADQGLDRYYDNDVYDFVPSGAAEPTPRDIVTTATCNRCHNPLGEHGGRYQEVGVCQQCHNPELVEDGLSYSFDQMVHRIHASEEPLIGEIEYPTAINNCVVCHTGGTPTAAMPLVANPNPATACDGSPYGVTELGWADVGSVEIRLDAPDGKLFAQTRGAGTKATGDWVMDGQKFLLLNSSSGEVLGETDVDLTVYGCAGNPPYALGGEAGALHSNWMTNPNRAACGSCHVNVDFETGEGHVGGEQPDDEFCAFCHEADSGVEFDRSVAGAHTVPLMSNQLNGVLVTIKEVTNTGPGQKPTVRFALTNKDGPLAPTALETLTFTLTGPNDDFEVNIRESNAMSKVVQAGSDWAYTFTAAVPADAEGSYSVGAEGRITVTLNGASVRDSMENPVVAVAVTDAEPEARRMIVDDAKCESCHANLSLHGDNRKNSNVYCQTCHMPDETDAVVRLEGLDESIHFKYMVHKIHRGADLENGYVVYGFRNSVNDYSEVGFPGDLRDCEACHVEGTYGLPLPEGALPTYSPNTYLTEMGPMTATCLSCHDGLAAASHADANTSSSLGESCDACHGDDKSYSVEQVHAR